MNRIARTGLTLLALSSLALVPACDSGEKKDEKAAKKDGKADAKKDAKPDAKPDAKADGKADAKPDAKADPKPDAPPAAADAAPENTLVVTASHAEPKPTDPVKMNFPGVKVVKADFDPKNPEGGTAEITIDVTTLASGSGGRDKHVKSEDYFDIAKFAAITVKVSDVKKAGDGYTAKLDVNAHGKDVSWDAVPFKVLETTDKGIKIQLTQMVKRADFEIGKSAADGDSVADEVQADLTLMIEKTA